MSKLVLNNNGLTDEDLASLLRGMLYMDTLSVIDLRKNVVGEASVSLMSDFMIRHFPSHL
jgi:Ran GTPase-activating protein (RanGAP) involved in mRNA processing and transport